MRKPMPWLLIYQKFPKPFHPSPDKLCLSKDKHIPHVRFLQSSSQNLKVWFLSLISSLFYLELHKLLLIQSKASPSYSLSTFFNLVYILCRKSKTFSAYSLSSFVP